MWDNDESYSILSAKRAEVVKGVRPDGRRGDGGRAVDRIGDFVTLRLNLRG